ncbi:MAG: HlyD family efflux transporter periplasmic adaptor subunit [Planctomycetota bacterium]
MSGRSVSPAGEARSAPIKDQKLFLELNDVVDSQESIDEFLRHAAHVISRHSDCLALWIVQKDDNENFRKIHSLTDKNARTVWDMISEPLTKLIDHTVETRVLSATKLSTGDFHQGVCATVSDHEQVKFALAGCFSTENQTAVRQQWLMGAFAQSFATWLERRNTSNAEQKTRSLNDALSLIQSLYKTETMRQSGMAIVNQLRRLCQADQVSLSLIEPGGKEDRLAAVSDVEHIDLNSESNRLIAQACSTATRSHTPLVFPTAEATGDASLIPLQQYCKSNRLASCIALPLRSESGQSLGGLLVAAGADQIASPGYTSYLTHMASLLAQHLEVIQKANRSIWQIAIAQLVRLKDKKWARIAMISAGAIALLMCLPLPYRVACECEVQPVMRRFISAPYGGILEMTNAQSGDLVEEGQVLALMDGRQLRIELAGLQAKLDGARKQHDSALAKSDYAAAQIARTEMNSFTADIEVVQQQLINLEIRSPIGGIVVSGDLEQTEGGMLEAGQPLFEVGPLDEMLAEIAIPESEIQFVETGMPVRIKLNSLPFRTWTGTVERIHPGTEIINDETVFIARVRLPNDEAFLRPGLKGSAKISTGWSPLGWNLFHRPWESVRYWTIW